MRNRLPVAIGVVALLAIAAGPASQPTVQPAPVPATEPATIPMTQLVNDEYHFQLKYPAAWKVLKHPVNSQVISIQTPSNPANDADFGVVGLRILPGAEGTSDPEILKEISGEMVNYSFNNGGKKVAIKPDRLGDIPARRITFNLEKPTGNSRVMCIVAVRKRSEYVFTIAAPTATFDQMLPGVDEVMKSFELTE